jgi:beta-glucanase (GH16 family)
MFTVRIPIFSIAMILTIALTVGLTASRAAAQSATASRASAQRTGDKIPVRGKYRLVFEDEFDGRELNTAHWDYRQDNTIRNGSVNQRSNVSVADGILHLAGDRKGNQYSASMISTENGFQFKYGYVECRADLSRITFGADVSFWLQSDKNGATMDPAMDGGEIDILEYNLATGARDMVMHNLHWNGYGAQHRTQGTREVIAGITTSSYHRYGLEWTQDAYVFYVDGVERYRVTANVSHRKEYIILSNEIMNTGFGGDRAAGHYPEYLDIDYVRVYQLRKKE